jgi:hypothetical protein
MGNDRALGRLTKRFDPKRDLNYSPRLLAPCLRDASTYNLRVQNHPHGMQ